jgi:hypothetical protein
MKEAGERKGMLDYDDDRAILRTSVVEERANARQLKVQPGHTEESTVAVRKEFRQNQGKRSSQGAA